MTQIIWRCVGHQRNLRKLAAGFDDSLYALDEAGRLLVNRNFGLDLSWQFVEEMPANIANLTCAAGVVYYQTDDRFLWYRSGHGERVRVGQPWGAAVIAGTEDTSLDFSILWALNDDKSLWQNTHSGGDAQWQRIGQLLQAVKIAASHDALFALNVDGSFWMNHSNGADGAWECIGSASEAVEITAASQHQSSAVQLYALHRDSSIWMGVVVSDCQVSLTTQDAYPPDNPKAVWRSLISLDGLGVTTDAWTIGGGHLSVNTTDTLDQFLLIGEDEIRNTFENYLERHPQLKKDSRNLIVLDMEAPVFPPGWGQPDRKPFLDKIFPALKMRISIVRRCLQEAKISMHAVIAPEAQGKVEQERFQNSMEGYRQAVDFGLFDELDYLSPVLYTRWGPADGSGAKSRLRYCTIAAYNRLGIAETAALIDKPLVPMLSLVVNNRTSTEDTHLINMEAARAQLTYLQSRPEVARVVYWSAPDSDNTHGYYVPPRSILRFFNDLEACGR